MQKAFPFYNVMTYFVTSCNRTLLQQSVFSITLTIHSHNSPLYLCCDYIFISFPFRTIQYNDLSNKVYTFSADSAPREYRKKCTLLLYFAEYMDEHLIHGGDILKAGAEIEEPTAIFMKKWFRTGKAIVMYLNNGTLQVGSGTYVSGLHPWLSARLW